MLLLIFILLVLHCTSGMAPSVKKIEVIYLGSIYEDIYKQNPISAGVAELPGIKITHTRTEPVFMEYYLYRVGLHELLKDLAIDYVIGDTLVQDKDLFGIHSSMGYAIRNYGGIRFAVVSSEDSLTIKDQVQLTLIKERSDIIWIVDPKAQNLQPSVIDFYISDRALSDTSMAPIKATPDTARGRMITKFRNRLEDGLNSKYYMGGRVADRFLSSIAKQHGVNMIIYPENLFATKAEADSMTLRELMECVAFEMKFNKTEMDKDEITETCQKKGLLQWGTMTKENMVLLPDDTAGKHIFDYYYTKE
jgi:hypothetical protein